MYALPLAMVNGKICFGREFTAYFDLIACLKAGYT
jgi:hypothetical protein